MPPALLFHKFWPHLPNLRRLATLGGAGVLRSCDPPITVPAWATMLTGHDPGTLGLYGFHDRADRSYEARRLASSWSYTRPALWDLLTEAGLQSYVLGVPHTYPPRPFAGRLVTGCLTPPDVGVAVVPQTLAPHVRDVLGVPALDVDAFRGVALPALVGQVTAATRGLFELATQWAEDDAWSLLALVDMGADRLQHALWRYAFAEHPRHFPGHPMAAALLHYYQVLDTLVGRLVDKLRPQDLVLVVSDHGACAMHRGVALNTWLMQHGYLVLHAVPKSPRTLQPEDVDWSRTRVWADGGYVGRLYVNQRGREPLGVVAAAHADALLTQIEQELCASLPTPPQPHRFLKPAEIYAEVRGCAPDRLVYLANLRWRAIASVGWPEPLVEENDRGPDGANHDADGVIVMRGPQSAALAPRQSIYDVAPTVLAHLQVAMPDSMRGAPVGQV